MPFIPNAADAFHESQASPDSGHFETLRAGSKATGVVSGCAVTAQGTPDMTVAVASGVIAWAGAKANVTAGNLTLTADGTNPRFYLIVASSAGVKSAVAGTPAPEMAPTESGPVFPAVPANSVVLASVYVPAADTDIDANQIDDMRVFVSTEVATNYDLAKARSLTLVQEKSQTVTLDTGQNLVHGSAMANGRLFLTTRTSPAWFIRCNNLEDLTDRDDFQFASDGNHNTGDACVYVAETDRVYVVFTGGQVAEVHPDTLATTDVFAVASAGAGPTICSDGTNLYILTNETNSRVLKYRISDFALQGTATLTGRAAGHAILWDEDKVYATGPAAPSSWIARITTSDMSFTDASLTGVTSLTDDMASDGDYLYAGRESNSGQNLIKIRKSDLTAEVIPCFADDIYAIHNDGRHIWIGHNTSPGQLSVLDKNSGYVGTIPFPTGEDIPNEIHSDGTGRLFVTFWMSPAKVKRFTPSGAVPLPLVGRLAISHVAVDTDTGAEKTLLTAAIPGLTLGLAGGKAFRVTATGRFAANTNAKRLILKFGLASPVAVFDTTSLAFNDVQWWLEAICVGTASGAQDWVTKWTSDSSLLATDVQHATTTQVDTGTLNVNVRGVGVADADVVNEFLLVETVN